MPVARRGNLIYLQTGSHTYCYDESCAPLGRGAMGTVYKGHDVATGKTVAIKRVKDEYANLPEIRHRAHLEARLMFSHPNLVEMLGCCEVASGRGPIFIISEYINGENMDVFVDRHIRPLPNVERRICEMFIPVLDALSYIHQKNIIHLDIKPSNIMVENGRNCRLMDLGIAESLGDVQSISSGMMGTPKYAAPEQFANSKQKPTFATDVYEAGVTLYELITKKNPFVGASIKLTSFLHRSTILEKTPEISDAVLAVLQKATAVNPAERYQHASEMKMALRQALAVPDKRPSSLGWLYVLTFVLLFIIAIVIIYLNK